jgi:hypothetical protein
MPGTTPIYALPYPVGTDPLQQGDNKIRELAERLEAVLAAAPYAKATGPGWGIVNGGVTVTLDNLTTAEEAGGITHAAGIFTVTRPGIYAFAASVKSSPLTAPHNGLMFWYGINGAGVRSPSSYAGDGHNGTNMWETLTDTQRMSAGDGVRLVAQGIGGQTNHLETSMSVWRIRD